MTNPHLSKKQKHALEQIKDLCQRYKLGLDDVKKVLETTAPSTEKDITTHGKSEKHSMLTSMLGYLGGTLIVAGFFFYVGIVWQDIGSFARVILSLGTGLLCFFIGGILQKKEDAHKAAPFLWSLSFLLVPTGLFVFLHEYIKGDDAIMGGVIVFGISLIMFASMWKVTQTKTLFTASLFFSLAFIGTLYERIDLNIPGMWLATGISVLLIAYKTHNSGRTWEAGSVFPIGAISFVASLYYFIGNTYYDVLMVSVLLGLILAGYILRSRNLLIISIVMFLCLSAKHYGFSAGYRDNDIFRITAAITGMSMAFAGHWVQTNIVNRFAAPTWYFLGSGLFFSAVMGLMYETPYDILFVVFPALTLYISLQLRSRALLVSSILAILSFISYYTFTYFANTVGWPLALMVMGLALIGLCAFAMKMNKRIQET